MKIVRQLLETKWGMHLRQIFNKTCSYSLRQLTNFLDNKSYFSVLTLIGGPNDKSLLRVLCLQRFSPPDVVSKTLGDSRGLSSLSAMYSK